MLFLFVLPTVISLEINPEMAPLHIDGDHAPTDKKFVIEILPSAFNLIRP